MVKKTKYKIRFWAGILFAQFLLFYLFSKSSIIVSFFVKLFHLKQSIHQQLFSEIKFSVGDIIYIVSTIYLVFVMANLFKKDKRKKYLHQFLITLNLFYFIYQIFWGMLYFDSPISEKLAKDENTVNEIKNLTLEYIKLTNAEREKVSENKNGVFEIRNIDSLKYEVIKAQKLIPHNFYTDVTTQTINIKPSIFGTLLNYTGILGYYNPFTSEAQFSNSIPSTYIPFTLAHESAHQLGFAREQEASFIGYLICEGSNKPEMKYSVYLYTSKSLLNYLYDSNPKFATEAKLLFSKKVRRDLDHDRLFADKHKGVLKTFFHSMNDWFLKSNQQDGSITYSYYIDLIINYRKEEIRK